MLFNIKSSTNFSGFYIVFEGSTMVEKPGWYGLSHLMEHLVCKSFEHLQDVFQQKNIKWNAYTSSSEVVFFMTGLDRHISAHKKEFLELILSYSPTQAQLDNEKKIVLEEYKRAFSSQMQSHYLNLQRKMFNYYDAIGLRSDIENFTLEDCNYYLDKYLKSPTKIINISQNHEFLIDIPFREKPELKNFEIQNNTEFYKIKSDEHTLVPDGKIPLELINDFKNKSNIILSSPVIKNDFAKIDFLCEMAGSGLNSPLYKEVREKLGLVYNLFCFNDGFNEENSMIIIGTDTSNNNVEKVISTIKNILDNKTTYLTQERFDIIKDRYKTKIEEAEILNHTEFRKYIQPDNWAIEKIIDTITLDEILAIADKYLNWDKIRVSVDKSEFE